MRNRTLLNGFMFISTMLMINNSFAETVSLEYKGFYDDRLKQVNKQNFPLVELAFSVPMTPDCMIKSGSITTEKEQYPLTYTKQQRIFIPYDAQLKSDRALVNIHVIGDASKCAIAMQVRAKEAKQSYTQTELLALTADMNRLLDGLQGFPMKYFRNPINGLTFEFDKMQNDNEKVKLVIDNVESMVSETYPLTLEKINQLQQISFLRNPILSAR
ncbi:DUF2987 domain-containing protein [Shewanella sp. H8]|uniref:DUF2987 domain-containing protein n=1 Tax=Shewanella sp. H8 TaxID=3342676 RepID=UPI003314CBFA